MFQEFKELAQGPKLASIGTEIQRLISQKKLCRLEGTGKYSKWWKARAYNLDYSIQQSYHLAWKGR